MVGALILNRAARRRRRGRGETARADLTTVRVVGAQRRRIQSHGDRDRERALRRRWSRRTRSSRWKGGLAVARGSAGRRGRCGCCLPNTGLWPVLVGEPGRRTRSSRRRSSSRTIPRSRRNPGDLFDATEIDEILSLRILALTDDEKAEMRAADPRSRALLDRTEALTGDDLMRLHGTIREIHPRWRAAMTASISSLGSRRDRRHHRIGCAGVTAGCIAATACASSRAAGPTSWTWRCDGRTAVVESIERDYEDRHPRRAPRRRRPGQRPRCDASAGPPLLLPARRHRAAGPAGRSQHERPPRSSSPGSATSSSATTASASRSRAVALATAARRRPRRRLRHPRVRPGVRAARRTGGDDPRRRDAPGEQPGTVYVLEPDLDDDTTARRPDHAEGSFQGHAMTPDSVFALVRTLGGPRATSRSVGCEPLDLRTRERG